jgi:hypothetical protein
MSEQSGGNTGGIAMVVIIFVIIGIMVLIGRQQTNYLEKHPVYTTGVITGRTEQGKGERYILYSFKVDTVEYKGRMTMMFCRECKDDCCEVGKEVKVRYAEGDPTNNDLVH